LLFDLIENVPHGKSRIEDRLPQRRHTLGMHGIRTADRDRVSIGRDRPEQSASSSSWSMVTPKTRRSWVMASLLRRSGGHGYPSLPNLSGYSRYRHAETLPPDHRRHAWADQGSMKTDAARTAPATRRKGYADPCLLGQGLINRLLARHPDLR